MIHRANRFDIPFKIEFDNGNDYDLTGKTVEFTVKEKGDIARNDDAALIKKIVTVFDDNDRGAFTISLSPIDTNIAEKEYKWDLLIKTDDTDKVNTDTGLFIISSKVTEGV